MSDTQNTEQVPEQMELFENQQHVLTLHELQALLMLATTGRDLLRRTLLAGQVPTEKVFIIKRQLTTADRLIEKMEAICAPAGN